MPPVLSPLRVLALLAALLGTTAQAEERLAMPDPTQWERVNWLETASVWRADYRIPPELPGSGGDGDVFSIERFGLDELPDPLQFMQGYATNMRALCGRGARTYRTFTGTENGYDSVVRLVVCPKAPDSTQGEVTMMKAIRGQHGFYIAARTRRVPAFNADVLPIPEQDAALWSQQFGTILLCDTDDPEHPCAEDDAAALQGDAP